MALGLRQRKKEATRDKIIACAAEMFREQGYESSRIEDIAEAADLSVATFYNYFGSKADMLLATVLNESESVIQAVDACMAQSHDNFKDAFSAIVRTYFIQTFRMTSREMWREALARTMLNPEAEFSRRYSEIDQRLTQQLADYMCVLQEQGVVASGVDTKALAQLLFNNVNMNFIETMRNKDQSREEICQKIMFESEPVFALCRA